jgi:hypothetical protein
MEKYSQYHCTKQAFLDGSCRPEAHSLVKIVHVRVSADHIPRLHRQKSLVRLFADLIFDNFDKSHQINGLMIAQVINLVASRNLRVVSFATLLRRVSVSSTEVTPSQELIDCCLAV